MAKIDWMSPASEPATTDQVSYLIDVGLPAPESMEAAAASIKAFNLMTSKLKIAAFRYEYSRHKARGILHERALELCRETRDRRWEAVKYRHRPDCPLHRFGTLDDWHRQGIEGMDRLR